MDVALLNQDGTAAGDGGPRAVVAYATLFGATQYVAELVAEALGRAGGQQVEVLDLAYADVAKLAAYDLVVLGACTWNVGQLPPDLESNLDALSALELTGKHVAFFGTGDQVGYPDTFVDAIGVMAETMRATGAKLVGRWPADGYDIIASRALVGGEELLGLAIDEDNEPDLTAPRVAAWTAQVASEVGLRQRVSI